MLAAPIFLSGCTGAKGLNPIAYLEIQPPEGLAIETTGNDRPVYIQQPFEGGLKVCGMQKNSAYLDVGKIECRTNPADSLPALLTDQLRKAGFRVQTNPEQPKPNTLQIRGVMMKFFQEQVSAQSYETDVQLKLTAASDTGLQAERILYEKGRSADAQRSANSAVRKVLETMIAAITELLDDYPMLSPKQNITGSSATSSGSSP